MNKRYKVVLNWFKEYGFTIVKENPSTAYWCETEMKDRNGNKRIFEITNNNIWIANNLCKDEQQRTLKHELTHCYIWENGFYNVDFNNEELVCDFVASIYDFIKNVLDKENK